MPVLVQQQGGLLKVRDVLNNPSSIPSVPVKEDRKVSAGKGVDFRGQLAKVEGNNYQLYLEELVNQITRQGEKMNKKIDIKELIAYKKLISEFLNSALGNSRKFSKQSLLDRRGRHKVYALVKKINEELDQLTQDVMNEEKDNIGILKRVEDIRGLILDMLL